MHIHPITRPRKRRQGGNMMLEAGFILTAFFALFFATMDFGMAIFLQNTLQYAVRQGVRYAVTSQTMTGLGLGQDDSIKAVVNQYSMGFLSYVAPSGNGRTCSGTGCIAINYYTPSGTLVTGLGSNVGGNVVQVIAQNLTYSWMVPLWRTATPLTFSAASADVMEATPVGGAPVR